MLFEENSDDKTPATKTKRKARPRTAMHSKSTPRYLQPIHGEARKDDSFAIKSFFYRDLVLVRYKESQRAQIINEKQFINIFLLRNNDPYWKTVDYVQTNVKCQVGLGTPIVIKFYADLEQDPENPQRLKYDFEKYGEDKFIKNELIYCLKLCYKI